MSVADVQPRIPTGSQYIVVADNWHLGAYCLAFFCSRILFWFSSVAYFQWGGSAYKAWYYYGCISQY